jgi:hypothetical protein
MVNELYSAIGQPLVNSHQFYKYGKTKYMRPIIFPIIAIISSPVNSNATVVDSWSPHVYNAIKWTAANQDQQTIAYTTSQGITRVPIAYHGGVDWDESGDITAHDIERFSRWAKLNLPTDYCGPVLLDYERPWWKELGARSITHDRLQEIMNVYIQGINVAQGLSPTSQWGYWGLPLLRNTGKKWQEQQLTMEPLISQCSALFPDVYDGNRDGDSSNLAERHISKVLEFAKGRMPVYVFVSIRYTGQGGDHSYFIPHDVFLKQANAAMKAVWVDAVGVQHKIQGLILWDSYGFSPESEWADLDQKHKYYFELLNALTQAWKKESNAVLIETGVSPVGRCQYALPEPANSATTLDQSTQKLVEEEQTRVLPDMQSGPVGSDRIRGNRIKE